MITVFKPKIKSVHSEDGHPYIEEYEVLFSKHEDAIGYATKRLIEHDNSYTEPKAYVTRVLIFESNNEAENYKDAELIESARNKLTDEERKALGI